jgi:hypothetical protein
MASAHSFDAARRRPCNLFAADLVNMSMANHSRYWNRWALLLFALMSTKASAGPPFNTDDPQPVDYLHWEFYLASVQQFERFEVDATLPHIEINYGALPDVQLHIVAPMGYVHTSEGARYGYSNTEIGMKYRFVQETESTPQIGTFPLIEIPTGDKSKGLSEGKIQAYLPVWVQKSWGKLTTYGGGGFWYNPGAGQRNWGFMGWEVQYDFSKVVTLGGEVYYHTASSRDSRSDAGFNVGGFINFNDENHLLFSFGHSMLGEHLFSGYIGYQVTI